MFIGLGGMFFEQNHPYQRLAYMDVYLKLAAHFPHVCFLWNTKPDELRKRVNFWTSGAGGKMNNLHASWLLLQKALVQQAVAARLLQKAAAAQQATTQTDKLLHFPLENLEVQESFPQPAMLASNKLSAFVSHGGNNSVTEALAAGVPPLIISSRLNGDAPLAAIACEREGVGLNLEQVLGVSPHVVETYNFNTIMGLWLTRERDLTGTESENHFASIHQLDAKWDALTTFFQTFIIEGKAENLSGKAYTLADLKNNISAKMFDRKLDAGEEQYGFDEVAQRMLKMIDGGASTSPADHTSPDQGSSWSGPATAPAPAEEGSNKLSCAAVVWIVVGTGVLVFSVCAFFLLCFCRGNESASTEEESGTSQDDEE